MTSDETEQKDRNMDERTMQFRTGVMVICAFILVAILVVLFGELPSTFSEIVPWITPTYTIFIDFDRAPGVAIDTPVRKNGILIGRVRNVKLERDGVLITAAIDEGRRIYTSEVCRLSRSVLGGDAALEFVQGSERPDSPELVQPGARIEGVVGSDPLEVIANLEGDLSQAIGSISLTSDEVGQLARQVNNLLSGNEEQLTRIVGKAEQAVDGLDEAVRNVNEVIGPPEVKENLRQAVQDMPRVLNETREAMDGLRNTLALADSNLRNLEGLTQPLAERGDDIVNSIDEAFGKLDQLLGEFTEFTRNLNDSDGTISQLLSNPDLYQNVNQAASNLAHLTRELRPIIKDARVMMDKLARHPEDLGVRGLIQRRSGIK